MSRRTPSGATIGEDQDGPLLLALLMRDNNLNDAAIAGAAMQNADAPISDTLHSREAVQELLKPSLEQGDDGPLLLALLMGNNNLNAAAQKGAAQEQMPISNTVDARQAVQELRLQGEQAVPILKMRGVKDETQPSPLSSEQLRFWRDNG